MSRRRTVTAALVLLALSAPLPAAAQNVDADRLFKAGLADMMAGRYETGCPALSESYRLDPRPGTLFTLAECEAKQKRIATAYKHYSEFLTLFEQMPAAQQLRRRDQEKVARAQKETLAPLVPELSITLPAHAPPGTVVKRNGEVVATASLGETQAIDPGEYVFTVQAPSGPLVETRVAIAPSEKKRVVLETKTTSASASKPGIFPSPSPSSPLPPPPVGSDGYRVGAYVTGGIGIAGLGLGGVMGALAIGKQSTIKSECTDTGPDTALCSPEGKKAADSAKTFEIVSTVGFGVGAAGLVVATVLFILAPSRSESFSKVSRPGVGIGPLSLGANGAVMGASGRF